MTLNLEDKKAIVAELSEVAKTAISAAVADYRGLTVSQMTDLRVEARQRGIKLRIYRNTLARRALEQTTFDCLREVLTGPNVLMFCHDEPGAAAKLLTDFTKKYNKLEVRGFALDGQFLGPDKLKSVASLPSRFEALTQFAVVLNAPVTQLVRTLNEPVAQFVRVMGQIRDKKQAS